MRIALKRDQAYEQIRRRIADGSLKPGQQLPQGVDLAKEMGVSHITLRAALARLEKDGLIQSVHGRGTFVSEESTQVVFRTIGLILPSLGMPLTAEQSPQQFSIVTNLMSAAEQHRFEIRTLHRGRKNFDSASVRNMGVDGIVVIFPHSSDASMLTELRELGLPLITLNLFNESLSRWYDCVNVDFERLAGDSVTRLHEQGRRKIVFFSCFDLAPDYHPGVLLKGYLTRMAELGLPPTLVQPAALPYHQAIPEDIERMTDRQAPKLLKADAVICTHSVDSLALQTVLRAHGAKIPDEVAVVGCFDNAAMQQAGITTWQMPWAEVASEIAMRMETLIRAPDTPPRIDLVPARMVRRQSA